VEEKVKELIDQYKRGVVSRRQFLQQATALVGSLTAATALLETGTATVATAQGSSPKVDPNDPSLVSGVSKFLGEGIVISAYESRLAAAGVYPAVIVIHENRGLNDHIRDVARRVAKEGYVALAIDLLSRVGGTDSFATPQDATTAINGLSNENASKDLIAGINHLKRSDYVRGERIGVVGFCWGGGQVLNLATKTNELSAAVAYYGRNPSPIDLVRNITAPVLAFYGGQDTFINAQVRDELETALKRYNKTYETKTYPDAGHAFNNDTGPRYSQTAADDAWGIMLRFFGRHLKA
jgi:carboxymethylenebutenolidase